METHSISDYASHVWASSAAAGGSAPAVPILGTLSSAGQILLPIGLVLSGVLLVLIGRWGHRNADELVPSSYSVAGQQRRSRALRRGAIMCHVGAAVMVIVTYLVVANGS